MRNRPIFLATVASLALCAGAANADNLVLNPNFQDPRPGLAPPYDLDVVNTVPTALAGYAAADHWLTWAVVPGGRIRTRLEPSELYTGGRMLHVWGQEIDQVFLPIHTGPKYGYVCALVKVVSGRLGAGAGDQGNSGPHDWTGPGGWTRISAREQSNPVNQVALFGDSPAAEFYVQSVILSPAPIPCDRHVDITRLGLPPIYVKPDPYPWTQHPEQGNAVQPAGNPAQAGQPSPNGYFENMRPVQAGTPGPQSYNPNGVDHEDGHDHGGGKDGKAPQTLPQAQPSNQLPANQQAPVHQ